MRPETRIVMHLGLGELWDENGILEIRRGCEVGRQQVAARLRNGRVRFVVADCGHPLRWIRSDDCYRFWKEELKPHLIEPGALARGVRREDWPGEYFYGATEWGEYDRCRVILLEKYH